LVSGTRRDEASRECLLQIITDLGNYYRRRNLSHREKFGSTDPEAEAVIRELAIAYEQARQCFSASDGNGVSSVESSISLRLVTQQVPPGPVDMKKPRSPGLF
jgi:hypothetical protein